MARFADIQKGTRARTTVKLPLGGGEVEIGLRVLSAEEDAAVLSGAYAYAVAKGVKEPEDRNPIYDLGLWAHRALAACVDPESPVEAPVAFFASLEEIFSSEFITQDHLAFLSEFQQAWQSEHSPYSYDADHEDMIRRTAAIAAGDLLPFVDMSPGKRLHWARFTACRLLASLAARSTPSPSPPGTSSESQEPKESPPVLSS